MRDERSGTVGSATLYHQQRTKFVHPLNEPIICYLEAQARLSSAPGTFDWVEGFELHTHPDLTEQVHKIAEGVPSSAFASLFGCPVMVGEGIIFAFAQGMRFLAFRLLPEDVKLALELGARPVAELGEEWVSVRPLPSQRPASKELGDLRYWCEQAYAFALSLGRPQP